MRKCASLTRILAYSCPAVQDFFRLCRRACRLPPPQPPLPARRGHPREYAAQALALGLAEIGMSDHNPMPEHFDDWRMPISDFPRYLEMVDAARADVPQLPI